MDPRDSSPSRRISFFRMAPSDPPQTPRIYFFDVPSEGSSQRDVALDASAPTEPVRDTSTMPSRVSAQPALDGDTFGVPSRVSVPLGPVQDVPVASSGVAQPTPSRDVSPGLSKLSTRPTTSQDTSTLLNGPFAQPGPAQDASSLLSTVSALPGLTQDAFALSNGLSAFAAPAQDPSTGLRNASYRPTCIHDTFPVQSQVPTQPTPIPDVFPIPSTVYSRPDPFQDAFSVLGNGSAQPVPAKDTFPVLGKGFSQRGSAQDASTVPGRTSAQDLSSVPSRASAQLEPAKDASTVLSGGVVQNTSTLTSKGSSRSEPIHSASLASTKPSSQPVPAQGTSPVAGRASMQDVSTIPSTFSAQSDPVKDTSTAPSKTTTQGISTVSSKVADQLDPIRETPLVSSKVSSQSEPVQDTYLVFGKTSSQLEPTKDKSTALIRPSTQDAPITLSRLSYQPAPIHDTSPGSSKASSQLEPAQSTSTAPVRTSTQDISTVRGAISPEPASVHNTSTVLGRLSYQPSPVQSASPAPKNVTTQPEPAQDTYVVPSRVPSQPSATGRPRALSSAVPTTHTPAEGPPAVLGGIPTTEKPVEKPPAVPSDVLITHVPVGKPALASGEAPNQPTYPPIPALASRPALAQKTTFVSNGPAQEPKPSDISTTGTSSIVAPGITRSSAPVERPPAAASGFVKISPGVSQISASSLLSQAKSRAEDQMRQTVPPSLEKPVERMVLQKDDPAKPDALPRSSRAVPVDSEKLVDKDALPKPDALPRPSGIGSLVLEEPAEKQTVPSKPAHLPRSSRAAIIAAAKRSGEEGPVAKAVKPVDAEQSTGTDFNNRANVKGEDTAAVVKKTKASERVTEEPKSADAVKSDPAAGEEETGAPVKDEKEGQNEPVVDGPPPTEENPVQDVAEAPPEQPKQPQGPVIANRDWQTEEYKIVKGLGEADKHASQLSPEEWDQVLENCGVMYGWCIDRTKNRITRAPKPAFRLKTLPPPKPPLNPASNQDNSEKGASGDKVAMQDADRLPRALKTKPAFTVNDNSRIDVMVSAHEFETSMATNDFSSQCTEGSVSGGFGSFSATASASHSTSKSSASASSSSQYNKTMIAKFLFPRVDVFLHPSHLELTPELEEALKLVRDNKNIADLRRLQSDFGYLFCNRVTLGGRLQTLKIMDQKGEKSEQEQKQSFKTSVGVSVSSPYGGASASHSKEGGSASSSSKSENQHNEQLVFEAIGGDTLLASNPTEWVTTVGKLKNWRVIDRDSLTLMVDAIADLPGLDQVKNWYRKAAPPKLKEYIEFAGTTDKQIRLRLLSPNHGLSCSYLKHEESHNSPIPPAYYLGHGPGWTAMPKAMRIDFTNKDTEWEKLVSGEKTDLLFSPASYRAPAIYGYASNKVGGSEYGIDSGHEFATTVWNIFAVQDEALCNGSQVTLRSQPRPAVKKMQHEGTTGTKEDFEVPDFSHPEASLMVFRNQQGVFLPGMSDSEDVQTWRILKKGAEPGSRENIKEGDEIRLAWCFEDQHVGYRDFTDDVFGRRRTGPPPGMENTALFMKLPWPRFEPIAKPGDKEVPRPNALVMSSNPNDSSSSPMEIIEEVPTLVSQRIVPTKKDVYYMQDCTFRLDFVGNQGRGEVHDYLLRGVAQDNTKLGLGGNDREQEAEEMLARFLENRRQKSDRISMGLKLAAFGPFGLAKRNPIASFLGF